MRSALYIAILSIFFVSLSHTLHYPVISLFFVSLSAQSLSVVLSPSSHTPSPLIYSARRPPVQRNSCDFPSVRSRPSAAGPRLLRPSFWCAGRLQRRGFGRRPFRERLVPTPLSRFPRPALASSGGTIALDDAIILFRPGLLSVEGHIAANRWQVLPRAEFANLEPGGLLGVAHARHAGSPGHSAARQPEPSNVPLSRSPEHLPQKHDRKAVPPSCGPPGAATSRSCLLRPPPMSAWFDW